MLYYIMLNGTQITGFDTLKLAKYKVIELYQKENLKCDITFVSYTYGKNGIIGTENNIITFENILNQFESKLI